jgi:hypothetical protein
MLLNIYTNSKLITINNEILTKYNIDYFKKYPRRRTPPIKKTIPPSLNEFITMVRMAQNNLKAKYKEFAIWLAEYYEIDNMRLEKAHITYTFYFGNKRKRDFDNCLLTPKFINDGFVDAGVFIDDNGEILSISFNPFEYDKNNAKVEMLLEW